MFKLSSCVTERQVKLAYVMTEAKPPPQVRRKQARFGTGHVHQVEISTPSPGPSRAPAHHRSSMLSTPPASPARKQHASKYNGYNISGFAARGSDRILGQKGHLEICIFFV